MAVQPVASRSVPLYVLIIFIVLFLASTTGLVVLFVHQEELRQQTDQAKTQFDEYIGSKVKSQGRLERYKEMGKTARPARSAVGALLDERDQLAQLLTGNSAATAKEAADKLNQALGALPEAQAAGLKESAKADLIGALQQVASLVEGVTDQLKTVQDQLTGCQQRNNTITKSYKDVEKTFTDTADKFKQQLADLQKRFQAFTQEYNQNLESIRGTVSDELKGKLDELQKTFSQHIDEMQDMVRRNLRTLIRTMKQLGPPEFRATAHITAGSLIQKEDGQVLDLAGELLYIDLGKEHGLKPGARFVVYSSMERGSTDPQIKAVIEVTEVGKLTSEARAIKTKPGEPILQGDLISNLAFNREFGKLQFFAFGEFDVNGDGIPDPDGLQQIQTMITSSGAVAAKQLSPTVNVAVVGSAPKKPEPPAAGATAQAEAEYEKKLKTFRAYKDLKDLVSALALPQFGPDRFLKFTGYSAKLD